MKFTAYIIAEWDLCITQWVKEVTLKGFSKLFSKLL